jgi:hypothetical protein
MAANAPRLETRLTSLREQLDETMSSLEAMSAEWLDAKAGGMDLTSLDVRVAELLRKSRRLESKIRTARKRTANA